LDCAGNPIDVPIEWTPALIDVAISSDAWRDVRLFLQRQEIPVRVTKLGGQARVLADWPRANPGNYHLRLETPCGAQERIVVINPRKISSAALDQLIVDLELRLPAAIAMGLQRGGALAGIKLLPPSDSTVAQEINRLRRAVDGTSTPRRAGLVQVLEDLADRPHRVLRRYEPWVKRERARRPHPARLKDAVCRGYNHAEDGGLLTIVDTRSDQTADVYENQLLKVFVHQVGQRLWQLKQLLAIRNQTALEQDIADLTSRLMRARRQAAFLDEVSLPRQLPTQTTMVLLNRPAYRAAFQGFIEFRQATPVRLNEPMLDAPIENVPHLYQLWGTMVVINTLINTATSLGFRVRRQRLLRHEVGGLCVSVLPNGKTAVELHHPEQDCVVRLIPESRYGTDDDLHSISFPQKPDVAIEVRRSTDVTRVLLFDPKYKLESEEMGNPDAAGRPQKVDIDKMHAYRDAIRGGGGQRVVVHAAILYPGPETIYKDGIEALQAYPGHADRMEHRIEQLLTTTLTGGATEIDVLAETLHPTGTPRVSSSKPVG